RTWPGRLRTARRARKRASVSSNCVTRGAGETSKSQTHLEAINMSTTSATWNLERIELLKRCFHAGLTCSQIANEIGVTRNAVIGKMSRMGLSRPRDVLSRQLERRRASGASHVKTPRLRRPKRSHINIFDQHEMLAAAFPDGHVEDVPIHNGRGCTLLELSQAKCR